MSNPLVVLVPDPAGIAALAGVPDVLAVPYDLHGPLPEAARAAEALVVLPREADRQLKVMRRLPALRFVQTLSAGADQWLGRLPAGVALANARGAHGAATAEWAVTALLTVYREFPRFLENQSAGRWDQRVTDTLAGKRVLILGAGDLGTRLRLRLDPFDVEVAMVARRARPGVHTLDEVPGLLARHDAVVVMLPVTDDLHGLVDAGFLARMPDEAVLVNAARGPHVDTAALLAELERGRLRAALDVTDPEPLPADHPLWRAPGVLITPHLGGATLGLAERAWAVAARQLEQFARGARLDNLLT